MSADKYHSEPVYKSALTRDMEARDAARIGAEDVGMDTRPQKYWRNHTGTSLRGGGERRESWAVGLIALPFLVGLFWHRGEALFWWLAQGWQCVSTGTGC